MLGRICLSKKTEKSVMLDPSLIVEDQVSTYDMDLDLSNAPWTLQWTQNRRSTGGQHSHQ